VKKERTVAEKVIAIADAVSAPVKKRTARKHPSLAAPYGKKPAAAYTATPLSTWLLATLKRKNLTQADLVRYAGLSKGHVNALCRGFHSARGETIKRLAVALDVKPELIQKLAAK